MQSPEHNGGIDKSKKPVEGSVFDKPGPLYPGFEQGKTHEFNREMRIYRRGMISLGGIAGLVLIVGIVKAFCSPSKRK